MANQPFIDTYLLYLLARVSDGEASVGRLAEVTLTKQATLSKALDRLESEGLVQRLRSDADRRSVLVALTPKGQAMADDLIPRARSHQASLLEGYKAEERDALQRILQGFLAQIEQR